ncbi:hypothetical protein EW145_g1707 [Phellinidium pouzarii]|uniref:Uncharacterized protein n=1 Tax=Phellinidium pouzarii TaxID=167371 RepID=A0A4V3XDI0_9AGAM|nr:hypothetical protein EW145_g1707 [Phellinidium pouzarii]
MNSPPYSSSEASLPPIPSPDGINQNMRSLLASTWQVLDQPPPPSLREILAAYKHKGDGDREMLLAMLNAKSAEDQRLASLASLRRTVLDICQTTETSPPPHLISQYAAPAHPSPHLAHEQYRSSPATYTPPALHQQIVQSPPLTNAHAFDSQHIPSQRTSLPPMRLRPSGSGSGPATDMAEPQARRKRARPSQPPNEATRAPHTQLSQDARFHTTSPEADLPLSPYSSARERSMSVDSNEQPAQLRERGAMAIGSLLSGNGNKVKSERERDDSWISQSERRDRDGPSHSTNTD